MAFQLEDEVSDKRKPWEFVPEDFYFSPNDLKIASEQLGITKETHERYFWMVSMKMAANKCNELLRQWESESPVVYCRLDSGKWACDEHQGFARTTHIARLVQIEEISESC